MTDQQSETLRTELTLAAQTLTSELELGTKIVHFAVGAVPTIAAIAVALVQVKLFLPETGRHSAFDLPHTVKIAVVGLLLTGALIVLLSSRCLRHVRRRYVHALRTVGEIRGLYDGAGLVQELSDARQRAALAQAYRSSSTSTSANLALAILFGGTAAGMVLFVLVSNAPNWLGEANWRAIAFATVPTFLGYTLGLHVWFIRTLLSSDDAAEAAGFTRQRGDQRRMAMLGWLSLMAIGASLGASADYIAQQRWTDGFIVRWPASQYLLLARMCLLLVAPILVYDVVVGIWRPAWRIWGYGAMRWWRWLGQGLCMVLVVAAAAFLAMTPKMTQRKLPMVVDVSIDKDRSDPGARYIRGHTRSLPDGATLSGDLRRQDGAVLASVTTQVEDNAFMLSALEAQPDPLPKGATYTWRVEFAPEGQEHAVLVAVGERGQLMDVEKGGAATVQETTMKGSDGRDVRVRRLVTSRDFPVTGAKQDSKAPKGKSSKRKGRGRHATAHRSSPAAPAAHRGLARPRWWRAPRT